VPSPSPPPHASESINKNPLETLEEPKGARAPTGIRFPSFSNLHCAVFPVPGSVAIVPGEVHADGALITV
jgi:hypothetical protein